MTFAETIQVYEKAAMKPKNKHLFTIGFSGICKKRGKLIIGRLKLQAQDQTHAIERATKFYEKDFNNLEIYGCHLSINEAA